jgi:8-oxo-dGTP pyrophosphatase MutT (NUDIX family)
VARVTIKARRLAAENTKWRVYFNHLSDEQGNDVPDYLTIEGQSPRDDRVTGVTVLPVLHNDFVLVRAYRHALGTELWEVPRGFLDAAETPADAALRELTEETGLSCPPSHLVPLGCYAPEASTMAARGALFAATQCTGTLRLPEDEIGLRAIESVDATRMSKLVADGQIEDAATLLAYYRFREWRGEL